MTTVEVFMDRAGDSVMVGQAHVTRQRGQVSTTFLYDPGYLAGDGMSIDPALLLVSGAQPRLPCRAWLLDAQSGIRCEPQP